MVHLYLRLTDIAKYACSVFNPRILFEDLCLQHVVELSYHRFANPRYHLH